MSNVRTRNFWRSVENRPEVLEKGKEIEVDVSTDKVKDFLGIEKFRLHAKEEESEVGVSTGLALTQVEQAYSSNRSRHYAW